MSRPITVTAYGGAQVSVITSRFGTSSLITTSTNTDTRLVAALADYPLGTGDFTFEAWVYLTEDFSSTDTTLFSTGNDNSDVNDVRVGVGGTVNRFTVKLGTTAYATSSVVWSLRTWYHLALVRNSGSVSLYINGTKDTSIGTSGNISFTTDLAGRDLGISRVKYAAARAVPGYIDEVRISNTARYTSNFTPPVNNFISDSNTLLLLHMDGANTSTTFTDDTSAASGPEPIRGQVGLFNIGITRNTTVTVFGDGSARFPSNSGNRILTDRIPDMVTSGDFTIEGWFRIEDTAGGRGQLIRNYNYETDKTFSTGSFDFYFNATNSCALSLNGQTLLTFSTTRYQYHHIAIVRSGSTVTVYRDGTSVGTRTWTQTLSVSGDRYLFGWQGSGDTFNGYMDEIRFSKVARYTSNFTPPTAEFVNDSDTALLLHFDTTPFTDDYFGPGEIKDFAGNLVAAAGISISASRTGSAAAAVMASAQASVAGDRVRGASANVNITVDSTVNADRTRDNQSAMESSVNTETVASRTRDNTVSAAAEFTTDTVVTRIFELGADFENLFTPGMTANAVKNMFAILDSVTDMTATVNRTADTGGLLEFLADLDAANDRLRDIISSMVAESSNTVSVSITRELAASINSAASSVISADRIKNAGATINSTASIAATVTTIINTDNKYIETGYIDPGYYEIVDFVIEEAEAHVTAEFAVSAVGLRIQPGDAVFNAEFTASSVAERIVQGSAQISAEFAVSALAVETDDFVIDISSTSSMAVAALRIQSGVVSAESLFSSTVSATVSARAGSNINSTASVSADVGRLAGLSSNILSEVILLAEGSGTRTYSASIATESALVADVQIFSGTASTMDLETALAADANRTRDNETDILAAAWMETATRANYSATIAAVTLFDVGVAAQASVDRGADLEVTADIIIGPTITARAQAALDALSNAEIANQRTRDNTIQGPAEFAQITLANRTRDNAAALSADSAVSAIALRIQPGTVTVESTAIVTIAADRIRGTSADINSNSSLNIEFTVIESAQVDIAAEFNASATNDRIRGVAVEVTSTSSVQIAASRTRSGSASLNSEFTVYADSRGLGIVPERTYRIPAERRVYVIPAENRIYQIPGETRTWKVT